MQALEYRLRAAALARGRAADRPCRHARRGNSGIGREAVDTVIGAATAQYRSATREVQPLSRAQSDLEGSFIRANQPMTKGVDARVR
jgi:hypothetical protein